MIVREHEITFPGYMERCCGFTVPENGIFYAFYFEYNLARFDIRRGECVELDEKWSFDEATSVLRLAERTVPFIGLWGGQPLLRREEFGELSLKNSVVQLETTNGDKFEWQFSNFSGDWESVTFDSVSQAFLYGARYDFDFRYVDLSSAP